MAPPPRAKLREWADGWNIHSPAGRLRNARKGWFVQFISDLPRPVRIIDVGGCEQYYTALGFTDPGQIHVTMLNLRATGTRHPNFVSIAGDGRDMREIETGAFDVVFSNSTIEHVGGLREQKRFAQEVMRVGKRYFVQTPHFHFPIEPHFLVPGFQWLPVRWRALLHSRMTLGWWEKAPSFHAALEEVESIRLIREAELRYLFPGASIRREKYFGLTKSFVVTGLAGQIGPGTDPDP
jgi:hypothetical protein